MIWPPSFSFFLGERLFYFFFFFSSRRRHTRSLCDWSSDVCSSDLKGWPMKDRKRHMAAKREAFEEAGVRGQIGKRPIGSFVYDKRLKSQATVSCKVEVFPLKVRKQAEVWPERGEREGRWFSPDE